MQQGRLLQDGRGRRHCQSKCVSYCHSTRPFRKLRYMSAEHSLRLHVKVQALALQRKLGGKNTNRQVWYRMTPPVPDHKLFDSDSEHSTEDDNDRTDVFQWTFCSNGAEATEMMRGECCVVSHSGYSGKAVLVCPCNVSSTRMPLFSCSEQCYKEKSEPDCRTCRHADTPAVSSPTCPHRNTSPEGPEGKDLIQIAQLLLVLNCELCLSLSECFLFCTNFMLNH